MADVGGNDCAKVSLKDQGNTFFKSGNYLKAAALYTQAIKLDPENSTLYRQDSFGFIKKKFFIFLVIGQADKAVSTRKFRIDRLSKFRIDFLRF